MRGFGNRFSNDLEQRSQTRDRKYDDRESSPRTQEIYGHCKEARPHAGAPDAFEKFVYQPSPSTRWLLRPTVAAFHQRVANEVEYFVVGKQVYEPERCESQKCKVEKP